MALLIPNPGPSCKMCHHLDDPTALAPVPVERLQGPRAGQDQSEKGMGQRRLEGNADVRWEWEAENVLTPQFAGHPSFASEEYSVSRLNAVAVNVQCDADGAQERG